MMRNVFENILLISRKYGLTTTLRTCSPNDCSIPRAAAIVIISSVAFRKEKEASIHSDGNIGKEHLQDHQQHSSWFVYESVSIVTERVWVGGWGSCLPLKSQ